MRLYCCRPKSVSAGLGCGLRLTPALSVTRTAPRLAALRKWTLPLLFLYFCLCLWCCIIWLNWRDEFCLYCVNISVLCSEVLMHVCGTSSRKNLFRYISSRTNSEQHHHPVGASFRCAALDEALAPVNHVHSCFSVTFWPSPAQPANHVRQLKVRACLVHSPRQVYRLSGPWHGWNHVRDGQKRFGWPD